MHERLIMLLRCLRCFPLEPGGRMVVVKCN